MPSTVQRVKKVGGSLMVRIPREIVELERIESGEAVELEVRKIRKDWFGSVPGLKPFNKKEDRAWSKYE